MTKISLLYDVIRKLLPNYVNSGWSVAIYVDARVFREWLAEPGGSCLLGLRGNGPPEGFAWGLYGVTDLAVSTYRALLAVTGRGQVWSQTALPRPKRIVQCSRADAGSRACQRSQGLASGVARLPRHQRKVDAEGLCGGFDTLLERHFEDQRFRSATRQPGIGRQFTFKLA